MRLFLVWLVFSLPAVAQPFAVTGPDAGAVANERCGAKATVTDGGLFVCPAGATDLASELEHSDGVIVGQITHVERCDIAGCSESNANQRGTLQVTETLKGAAQESLSSDLEFFSQRTRRDGQAGVWLYTRGAGGAHPMISTVRPLQSRALAKQLIDAACAKPMVGSRCAPTCGRVGLANGVVCSCRRARSGAFIVPAEWGKWACESAACAEITLGTACDRKAPRCETASCVEGRWLMPAPPP